MNDNIIPNDLILEGHRTGAAIYALEHVPSGRKLVCCASNFSKRAWSHLDALATKDHPNLEVQADLLRDGPDAFRIVVLELVDRPSTLWQRKRLHVEKARAEGRCYNAPPPPSRRRITVAPDAVVTARSSTESGEGKVHEPSLGVSGVEQHLDEIMNIPPPTKGRIYCHQRVGGLFKTYYRKAA